MFRSFWDWIKSYFVRKPINIKVDDIIGNLKDIFIDEPLTLEEYQRQAFTVAKYPERGTGSILAVAYCGLGLGESGEIQGKIKKVIRDSGGKITPELREAIIAEMGDNLWYLAALATELGVNLNGVGRRNLNKLFDRDKRGVICGSGDNR